MKNRENRTGRSGWRFGAFVALAAALMLGACDFEVTNPGPVPDTRLDDVGAHEGVIQGAQFSLSIAQWQVSYMGAESAREITRSGRNFCCPKAPPRVGDMRRAAVPSNTWNVSHRARFTAEDATRRFAEVLSEAEVGSYALNAEARLLAGYANRLMGENFCTAVFDGAAPEPGSAYFVRAEQAFSDAIDIGQAAGRSDIVTAAYAGRASVRGPWMGNWEGAIADAGQVPRDFVHQALYDSQEEAHYNHMWWLGSGNPWVDWTVIDSDFESHYLDTGDPRTPWVDRERSDTPLGLAVFEQRKFTSASDNVNLSSGREMLLIRAEAALNGVGGDWEDAVAILNDLRSDLTNDFTGDPLPGLTAANAEEAWTHLKNERRWELWLEGRRMGDLRRWIDAGTPGDMEDTTDRNRLCFPVAQSEVNNNENIDDTFEDPVNPTWDGS